MATAWAASVFSGDLEHGFLLREQNAGFGPSLQPWPGCLQGSCAELSFRLTTQTDTRGS